VIKIFEIEKGFPKGEDPKDVHCWKYLNV